jgi:O-acetyl-ADP-ribose deacetylase (regulator of RNase III)
VIRVIVDDLAALAVDAVVRPADASLDPVTPAASRIDGLAGDRFAVQRRISMPLEAGAAVVTGGGELAAGYVVHAVILDAKAPVGREVVRRALIAAWQRASDWGFATLAAPLVGAGAGQLSVEESATLLAETFPRDGAAECPVELRIVVAGEAERALVEAIVRRMT